MISKLRFENREAEIMELIDSRYYISECLGIGGFGYVFKVIDKKTETEHAAKFMSNEAYDKNPSLLEEEANRLERVKHPGVIEFHDFIDGRVLLMEFFDGLSIREYQRFGNNFTSAKIRL